MTETPEGFLICHDVPINRTGTQKYLAREIGLEGDELVTVIRTEEEVFSREALASFEGKPVTQDHPPGYAVKPYNYGMYAKGHTQNVRRGSGADADCSMADLFINDPDLIRAIKDGTREVSCGYECSYVPDGKGHFFQREIRGNHVAVVAAGRAGHRVSIKDSLPESVKKERNETMSKEKDKKPSLLSRFFMGWAADKDPEEAANALDELLDNPEEQKDAEPEQAAPAAAHAAAPAPAPAAKDDAPEVVALLKQVLAKLEGQQAAPDTDPLQQLADELAGTATPAPAAATPEDQESSVTVPAEEMKAGDEDNGDIGAAEQPKNPIPGADSAVVMLEALRPYLAKLPEKERRAAADAALQSVRQAKGMTRKATSDGYAAIQQAMKQRGAAAKKSIQDEAQIGKSIMAKHNAHAKKN